MVSVKQYFRRYSQQYYSKHKKRILKKQKQYSIKNKKAISEYGKRYRFKNKKRIAERNKRYYRKHRTARLAYDKKYRNQNKKKYIQLRLKFKYGLTIESFDKLLKKQNNKCRICSEVFTQQLKPCVDHNHITGKVRGLLCNQCNKGLGNFKDSPELLIQASKYLQVN